MPETRGKISDIKVVIRETIQELFSERDFLSRLADKLLEKINLPDISEIREVEAMIKTQNTEFDTLVEAQNVKIVTLEKENESLRRRVDKAEQYSRRKQVRLIGVKETAGENLSDVIQVILRDKLKLNCVDIKPSNCFRIGKKKSEGDKPRQVMLRLTSFEDRSLIMKQRKLLKGSGIIIVEDLTKTRHHLLKAAQEAFNKTSVWTLGGNIFARVKDEKYMIASMRDVEELIPRKNAEDCVLSAIGST